MDSDSDGDDAEYSGITPPPILAQLQNILSQYRNDVQIIKELVQNADDAGAKEMKVLYVGEDIQPKFRSKKKRIYEKFIKAPALVVYNDAMFSETDWKYIATIYDSSKTNDPLKVGRFGLGFKSVFHLTDCPCIISGDRFFGINPLEKFAEKVCVKLPLSNLNNWTSEDRGIFMMSIGNTFDFTETTVNSEKYEGSLFWFPLRTKESELSANICTQEQILGLLNSFRKDSDKSLLFLKTISKVSMFAHLYPQFQTDDEIKPNSTKKRKAKASAEIDSSIELSELSHGKNKPFFSIELGNASQETKSFYEKRMEFMKKIESNGIGTTKIPNKTLTEVYHVLLTSEFTTVNPGSTVSYSDEWFILTQVQAEPLTTRAITLLKNKNLHHLVGVAAPLVTRADYQHDSGHVFCYQPLPQESKKMTGLPVHFNAFFELGQNRRHIEWPDENDLECLNNVMESDSSDDLTNLFKEEWNMTLLTTFLPDAYVALVKAMVQRNASPHAVYNAIPNICMVEDRWSDLASIVLKRLVNENILFTEGKQWLGLEECVIAIKERFPELNTGANRGIWEEVTNVVRSDMDNLVFISPHVVKAIEKETTNHINYLTPSVVSSHLRQFDSYKTLNKTRKLALLNFVLLKDDWNLLDGLHLLPLEDDSFTRFGKTETKHVFMEDRDVVDLFLSTKGRFMNLMTNTDTWDKLLQVKKSGMFQLCETRPEDICELVATIDMSMNMINLLKWIKGFWKVIVEKGFVKNLKPFAKLKVFPVNIDSKTQLGASESLRLACLDDILMLTPTTDIHNRGAIHKSLSMLGVILVDSLPSWLDNRHVRQYLYNDSPEKLQCLLEKLATAKINDFNTTVSDADKVTFAYFLSEKLKDPIESPNAKHALVTLKMFPVYCIGQPETVCLADCGEVYSGNGFPIRTHNLIANSEKYESLLKKLGATFNDDIALLSGVLDKMEERKYENSEIERLVFWVLEMETTHRDTFMAMFKERFVNLKFLLDRAGNYRRPNELFDPSDDVLRSVFADEDDVFPQNILSPYVLDSLTNLGLKGKSDVTELDIKRTVDILHKATSNEDLVANSEVAVALMRFIDNNMSDKLSTPAILELNEKRWIQVSCSKPYPEHMPFKNRESTSFCTPKEVKTSRHIDLVGSVFFIIDSTGGALESMFKWNENPLIEDVLKHLSNMILGFQTNYKAESLSMIVAIYTYLNTCGLQDNTDLRNVWEDAFPTNSCCVWSDLEFVPVHMVYVDHNNSDIDLTPFIYPLSPDMKGLEQLFTVIGCKSSVGLDAYLNVLKGISDQKQVDPKMTGDNLLRKAICVLNKLVTEFQEDIKTPHVKEKILLPIQNSGKAIKWKPIAMCMLGNENVASEYDEDTEDEDEDDDDDIYIIHRDVPLDLAKRLGVLSKKQHMLADADAFEEWGQDEKLTRRLHVLLKEGYCDGVSLIKELLQNADDAGATRLYFLYDERENDNKKTFLINKDLSEWQGPALWVYNDALFTENDLQNITKLNGGTKEDDPSKIGKFGLGFCSVYNLTDVPSFISGSSFVIFDPHTSFIGDALPGKSPGVRINFEKQKNSRQLKKYKHQFGVFEDIFGCKIIDERIPFYNGTLFRLPLRKRGSDISSIVYTKEEIIRLLYQTVEMAPNMFLFNQNVQEIKLFYLSNSTTTQVQQELYCLRKQVVNMADKPSSILSVREEVLEACRHTSFRETSIKRLEHVQITSNIMPSMIQLLNAVNFTDHRVTATGFTNCDWLISWATGTTEKCIDLSKKAKGCLPLGSVAIPIVKPEGKTKCTQKSFDTLPFGYYGKGHYFFYLPLPIKSSLPFHISSQFSVTSDRKRIMETTCDDKDADIKGTWNVCLAEDILVEALLNLLENGVNIGQDNYLLWPRAGEGLQKILSLSFYQHITQVGNTNYYKYCVFPSANLTESKSFTIGEIVFLDPKLREDELAGKLIFEMLSRLLTTETLVDIPKENYQLLLEANEDFVMSKTIDLKQFVVNVFGPNIDAIFDLSHLSAVNVLKFIIIQSQNEECVHRWLRENPCIPADSDALVFRKPSQLVNPSSKLASMFKKSDERFPHQSLLSDERILARLLDLGMMSNVLPKEILEDRARSVQHYSETCSKCAFEQSKLVTEYIVDNMQTTDCTKLMDIVFLPIQPKPHGWVFEWKGHNVSNDVKLCMEKHFKVAIANDAIEFEKPRALYSFPAFCYVGSIELVLEKSINEILNREYTLPQKLGIQSDFNCTAQILKQLSTMSDTFGQRQFKDKFCVVEKLYDMLANTIDSDPDPVVHAFDSKSVVWVGKSFTDLSKIAKHHDIDCRPYLYALSYTSLGKYNKLFDKLRIHDRFSAKQFVEVLEQISHDTFGRALDRNTLKLCINLLKCLVGAISSEKISWRDLKAIYIPDEDMILRKNTELCFNDFIQPEKTPGMMYVHKEIPLEYAIKAGVDRHSMKLFLASSDYFGDDDEDFFQNEPLLTRLKRLVEGYPLDIGLVNELIQNADDAGATTIHFILDYDYHSTKDLLDDSMYSLQGPALCVYNDSPFTQNDLKGIQRLGRGSKDDDPSKIGRYGVGFNVVYNITDAPSFLTKGPEIENGETLCMFDPHGLYVPRTSRRKPGRRIKDLKSIRKHHNSVLSGYHEDKYLVNTSSQGTIFRFPLRNTNKSEINDIEVNMTVIEEILKQMKDEIGKSLLFLKSVREVKFLSYKNGMWADIASARSTVTGRNASIRSEFSKYQNHYFQACKQSKEYILSVGQKIFSFEVEIKHVSAGGEFIDIYQVVNSIGLDKADGLESHIRKGNVGLLPLGGVAICTSSKVIENCRKTNQINLTNVKTTISKHNLFCFLPLPLPSGLPVHVNGYFALDHESRRSLWADTNDQKTFKSLWNETVANAVIAPAYAKLLMVYKDIRCKNIKGIQLPVQEVMLEVASYFDAFPYHKAELGPYMKTVTDCVYQIVVKECFLPAMCVRRKDAKVVCTLEWDSLNRTNYQFPAFNSEESTEKDNLEKSIFNNLLRDIGMRVVSVKSFVQESMKVAGVGIDDISPKNVLAFLTTHKNSSVDKCKIVTGIPVHDSVLEDAERTYKLLQYVLKPKDIPVERFKELPLMLSSDGMLKSMTNVEYLFLTRHSEFFSNHLDKFLHLELIRALEEYNPDTNIIRRFTLKDFALLAQQSNTIPYNEDFYVPFDKCAVKDEWLQEFWIFFGEKYRESEGIQTGSTDPHIKSLLNDIIDLSVFKIFDSYDNGTYMCNPRQLYTLVDTDTFPWKTKAVLEKMKLPYVVKENMLRNRFGPNTPTDKSVSVVRMIMNEVSNSMDAVKVVNCLNYHRERIKHVDLQPEDCKVVLRYFNDYMTLQDMQSHSPKLKTLSLFVSASGEIKPLDHYTSAFLIPRDLPRDGLSDFVNCERVILVEEDETLKKVYDSLGIGSLTWVEVYTRYIIKHQALVSRDLFYIHLDFLAYKWCLDKSNVNEIIDILRRTSFIERKDELVKPSDLFDHTHDLFKQFCTCDEFLPERLQSGHVFRLMRRLGLIQEPRMEMFVRFARHIERLDKDASTEEVNRKSKLLAINFKQFVDKTALPDAPLATMADIKFILPGEVEEGYTKIFPKHETGHLISYKGSVDPASIDICWTTSSILPKYAVSDKLIQELSVLTRPGDNEWIKHVQNVGRAVKKQLNVGANFSLVEKIFESIYESIPDEPTSAIKEGLCTTPIIFYPEKKVLLQPTNCITDCRESEEIPPYLVKTPVRLGKYFEKFLKIGANKEATCQVFARVLCDIYRESCCKKLLPLELANAKKAMSFFVRNASSEININELYVLCCDGIMRNVRDCVLNDYDPLQKRVSKGKGLNYIFDGFQIKREELLQAFGKLPVAVKPRRLTEIICEQVNLSKIKYLDNAKGREIEDHIHSAEFIAAFLRVAKHCDKIESKPWGTTRESQIKTALGSIKVFHVTGIYTTLRADLKPNSTPVHIENTEEEKKTHIEKANGEFNVYFDMGEVQWDEDIRSMLAMSLNEYLDLNLHDNLLLVVKMLDKRTVFLSKMLDTGGIDTYDAVVEKSLPSPVPGMYVPIELHQYLDNDYGIINEHEYRFIALLLDDPSDDDHSDTEANTHNAEKAQVYIFVWVIRKVETVEDQLDILQKYEIDVGEETTQIVQAYQLFKFVRSKVERPSSSKALVLFDQSSASNRRVFTRDKTITEICKEIRLILIAAWKKEETDRRRIVKRLMFKWHPDKNPERVVVATKVFQYIQQCIHMLEKGKDPPEFEDDMSKSPSSSSGETWSSSWYGRYWSRYTSRRYRGSGTYFDFNSSFRDWSNNATYTPFHHYSEARRWQRQARSDLDDAVHSLGYIGHKFNWICFKAHQAAEKALKGARYAKDANNMRRVKYEHSLQTIAAVLSVPIQTACQRLETITGYHTRMRYPDACYMGGKLPCELYTAENARDATAIARTIVDMVESEYMNN